jgi:hypothetical protein
VRDDLPCGRYLLDLSLHRHGRARHTLGYGAIMARFFYAKLNGRFRVDYAGANLTLYVTYEPL